MGQVIFRIFGEDRAFIFVFTPRCLIKENGTIFFLTYKTIPFCDIGGLHNIVTNYMAYITTRIKDTTKRGSSI